jgi:putative DNA primase/helicase
MTQRLTESGNAEYFVDRHGDAWLFCAETNEWFHYDGPRWDRDSTLRIVRCVKNCALSMYERALATADLDERARLAKWAVQSEKRSNIDNTIALARSALAIRAAQLDSDPWLFNVLNGTLDLRTGQLRAHDRADFITKLAPWSYDPDAACPRFAAFLHRIFAGNETNIAFVRRAIGYSLTGSTSEQCLFLFCGEGANGKTTLLEVWRRLLGDHAKHADFGRSWSIAATVRATTLLDSLVHDL